MKRIRPPETGGDRPSSITTRRARSSCRECVRLQKRVKRLELELELRVPVQVVMCHIEQPADHRQLTLFDLLAAVKRQQAGEPSLMPIGISQQQSPIPTREQPPPEALEGKTTE